MAQTIETLTLPDKPDPLVVPEERPLPGVIILVHGVNSNGEWFEEAEAGLCQGLNERLGRQELDGRIIDPLLPNTYAAELDEDGGIIRNSGKNFISGIGRSPIIRFRWGYKAVGAELADFAPKVWLNEDDAWGGGPFQNGTSNLPDLWRKGLNDRLFLWLHVQMINPTHRKIYGAPPRQYFVHAARRLATLIAEIRTRDPRCPVTVVCHSQGNMISMAGAFIGEAEFGDKGVADTYVLCNPPYSFELLFGYSVASTDLCTANNYQIAKQLGVEREATFAAFLKRVAARADAGESLDAINKHLGMKREGLKREGLKREGMVRFELAERDDPAKGRSRDNRGKVFLYCNPHDAVISSATIQGIGWRGVTRDEMKRVDPAGSVFYQRVWAQDFIVGEKGLEKYHYWTDHYLSRQSGQRTKTFWHPESPVAKYRFTFKSEPGQTLLGKIVSFISHPICVIAINYIAKPRINADPPKDHEVPINAPPLPHPLLPSSMKGQFDEGSDSPKAALLGQNGEQARREAAMEARSEARRSQSHEEMSWLDSEKEKQRIHEEIRVAEDALKQEKAGKALSPAERQAADKWRRFFEKAKGELLTAGPQQATDHSTILKNTEHCRRVLAYDVAIGVCRLKAEDWEKLRELADWRYVPDEYVDAYYMEGKIKKKYLHEIYPPGTMPSFITDEATPKTVQSAEGLDL